MNIDFKTISSEKNNINIIKTIFSLLLLSGSIVIYLSLYSFLIHWEQDQSQLYNFLNKKIKVGNMLGKIGAIIGDCLIYRGIGICAFILPSFLLFFGLKILFQWKLINIKKFIFHSLYIIICFPVSIAFISPDNGLLSGIFGFEIYDFLINLIGNVGISIAIITNILLYIVIIFKVTPNQLKRIKYQKKKNKF